MCFLCGIAIRINNDYVTHEHTDMCMLFAFENRVGSVHVKCRHESGKSVINLSCNIFGKCMYHNNIIKYTQYHYKCFTLTMNDPNTTSQNKIILDIVSLYLIMNATLFPGEIARIVNCIIRPGFV